jgi:hypothetical protein
VHAQCGGELYLLMSVIVWGSCWPYISTYRFIVRTLCTPGPHKLSHDQ